MNRPRSRDQRRDGASMDGAWLAGALREQAEDHEADYARIEAGFERLVSAEAGRATRHGSQRRPFKRRRFERPMRVRLIGVPLGVLAAVATTGIAVGVTLRISDRPSHPATQAAASPSATRTVENLPSPSPATLHPAGSASPRSQPSEPGPTASPGPLTATGALDSHSNQYWTQEDLTVTTTRVISALHVTVTISGGATVQSTGQWTTILSQYIDGSVATTANGLTYQFTLKPGQTLQPGSYAFGFQFGRPSGHAFSLDAYSVTAITADEAKPASTSGGFTAAGGSQTP